MNLDPKGNMDDQDMKDLCIVNSFWENDLRVHRLFFDREDDAKKYFDEKTSLDRVLNIEDEDIIPTDRSVSLRSREHLFYVEIKGIKVVIVQ